MSLTFRSPPGVRVAYLGSRPLLTTAQGGRIALDATLLSIWQQARDRDLEKIIAPGESPHAIRAALACLAEAGLLVRESQAPASRSCPQVNGAPVSAVIVNFRSREWLDQCLPTLYAQTYSPLQAIVVDNASADGSADWIAARYPQIRLVRLSTRQSLAAAINKGVAAATGSYLFILNPDVLLEADAVAQMVAVAEEDPTCAAVAAKLKFSWAPAFLNGLGNWVGAFGWGADIALGHLDLGQFDAWREIPSACFAAALIPRRAWDAVGALDEKFPLYYEDSEWCYRARLLGYSVRAAPQAIIYHAFGGRIASGEEARLNPDKLRNVTYGRLRYATRILESASLRRFLFDYLVEDAIGLCASLLRRDWRAAGAYLDAWRSFRQTLPAIATERKALQARRVRSDKELLSQHERIPVPHIWHGLPELTWDIVQFDYLPLILSKQTHAVPEFADVFSDRSDLQALTDPMGLARARSIWRNGGWKILLHRIAKYAQWRLAQT